MDDIYRDYRNTLMNKGPYRAYFTSSRKSVGEYIPHSQHSPERHQPVRSEGERKEQHIDNTPVKDIETKNETNKTEFSQKMEQEKTDENKNEPSREKAGPTEIQERFPQTDITRRNRPSLYQDRIESRW